MDRLTGRPALEATARAAADDPRLERARERAATAALAGLDAALERASRLAERALGAVR